MGRGIGIEGRTGNGSLRDHIPILTRYREVMSKYPRTFHLPTSPGATRGDRRHTGLEAFLCRALVITEKMDGSNVCMETGGCFARSHGHTPNHPSFDAFKALHAGVKHKIPEGTQVFGEWIYAKHSIHYKNLPAYFMVFGVRHNGSLWESWDGVEMWAEELGVPTVPVLQKVSAVTFPSQLQAVLRNVSDHLDLNTREGFVVRWASSFGDSDFDRALGKWVRKGHIQTEDHWKSQEIVKNLLRGTTV